MSYLCTWALQEIVSYSRTRGLHFYQVDGCLHMLPTPESLVVPIVHKMFVYMFVLFFFPFSPEHTPCPTHPCLPPSNLPSLAFSMCHLYMFLDGPSHIIPYYPSPPSSLVTVTLILFNVWLCYACLFVLLIRFHL